MLDTSVLSCRFLCLFPLLLIPKLVVAGHLLVIGWKDRKLLALLLDLEWKSIINCWLKSKSLILFFLSSLSSICSLLNLLYFWLLFGLLNHLPLKIMYPIHDDAIQQTDVTDLIVGDYLPLTVIHGRHAVLREICHQNLRNILKILLKTICIFLTFS